jgi:glycosyltransferase involved in cell wall biosynthesis
MGYDRNPVYLFKAIAALIEELPSFREDFCLQLIGQIDYSIWEEINKAGVMASVLNVGSLTRDETLQKAQGSRVLLLLLNQQPNAEGRIPGKSFEYMALRRPILFIGDTNAEISSIIASVSGNPVCDYEDYEKIKHSLSNLYKNYKQKQDIEMSDSFSEEWSVVSQTKKLAGLLSEMTD